MSKSNAFLGIAISFAVGVFLASRFEISLLYTYVFLAITVVTFALLYLSPVSRLAPFAALFLFCVGVGVLRLDISRQPNAFEPMFGQKQKLEGYIVEDVDVRENRQMLTVQPKGYDQRILVTTTKKAEYFYGDWIVAEGKVAAPENFEDFDYIGYLQRYDVYGLMKYPKVLVLKDHQGNPIKEGLLKVKYAFIGRVSQFLKEPKGSLLLGILIGARKSLPQQVTDNFTAVGLSHVVAVSGYNISIIVGALGGLLAKLFGRKVSFWLSLLVVAGFVVIAGASASVLRAALMGFLLLLSFNIGRLYAIAPALCFAAFFMLIVNPRILYWDVGFQLSFLATFGIVYFVPLLEKLTPNWPDLLGTKSTLFTTLAAIIATLPLILFNFGRLSTVAPLVNILVLPIIPEVMLLGFLAFLPFLGPGFALAADLLLTYILKITETFARLPFANLEIKISWQMFLMLSAAITLFYLFLKRLAVKRAAAI